MALLKFKLAGRKDAEKRVELSPGLPHEEGTVSQQRGTRESGPASVSSVEKQPRQPRILVGPAGWSYEDWRGIAYPAGAAGRGRELETIARFFDTIEINTSFNRPPRPEVTRVWLRRSALNPRFHFTAKLYRRFTHERDASADDERAVKAGLDPMMQAGKLGALLLQFPWSFKNVVENRQYLASLLLRFREYPRVVEIRHGSWNQPDVLDFLREHGAGFCNLDQPLISRSLPPTANVTAQVEYVRLHGRNYESWFSESAGVELRYDYLYSRKELELWRQRIESIAARSQLTYVILNNHYQAKAVANAIQLRSMLENRPVPVPPLLLAHYPQLREYAATPVAQDCLFELR